MGYALAIAPCIGCSRLFTFNPVRVPSIVINGTREPICLTCVHRVNPMRRKNGLEEIVPLPDAYEECEESEIG